MKKLLILSVALWVGLPSLAMAHDTSETEALPAEAKPMLEREFREFKDLLAGTYTNQEDFYFEENLGMVEKRPTGESDAFHQIQIIDDAGYALVFDAHHPDHSTQDSDTRADIAVVLTDSGITLSDSDCTMRFRKGTSGFVGVGQGGCAGGVATLSDAGLYTTGETPFRYKGHFRRANYFKCWVSPQKDDGTYGFYNDVILHDQGGRVWLEGEGHKRVGLKMRNVVWAAGNNRPSLVLYTYQGDDADKAVSYAWTSPDEPRIGINLRWMQASCTKGDATITPGINLKTGSGN